MDTFINFNNNLDCDLNIETALSLSEQDYTHEELLNMLKHGNIAEKQIAALKFDKICSTNDVQLLLDNLTGCDGKIREAVAYKINLLIKNDSETRNIFADLAANTFAKATIDINANICRHIVNSAVLLKNSDKFTQAYLSYIIKYTNESLIELENFIFRDKKYVINKQLFKLYWCLEALTYFHDNIEDNLLHDILVKCIAQEEYTIREKCAQIVTASGKFKEIQTKLMNDENYYVRQVFISSMLP